ncbi:transposable element Tc1 transposase [Trichonephila clavipes]|nr:transposable element Tc1 transposase [Trichonephila clavipes]
MPHKPSTGMVWGAISFDSLTLLIVISMCGPSRICFATIPLQYPGLIFQQDNARLHMARVTMNCLIACQTLHWPARSSDVSLTEHVWDMMER